MRRILLLIALAALAASLTAAPGQGAKRSLRLTLSLVQEATIRHPHPPPGNAGDTFSVSLRMFTIAKTLGIPPKTPFGRIAFDWGPLNGSLKCGTSVAGCSGTTNLSAVITLPGGTITAGGKNLSLSHGEILPVERGTGTFKGVAGTVTFLAAPTDEGVLALTLPE